MVTKTEEDSIRRPPSPPPPPPSDWPKSAWAFQVVREPVACKRLSHRSWLWLVLLELVLYQSGLILVCFDLLCMVLLLEWRRSSFWRVECRTWGRRLPEQSCHLQATPHPWKEVAFLQGPEWHLQWKQWLRRLLSATDGLQQIQRSWERLAVHTIFQEVPSQGCIEFGLVCGWLTHSTFYCWNGYFTKWNLHP